MGKEICAVPECGRPRYCKGYCAAHYKRFKATGSPGEAHIGERGRVGCIIDGCDRKHYSKGYCMAHYERTRSGGDLTAAIQERGRTGCAASGCAKPHYSLGYCSTHYERLKAKGTVDDAAFQPYGRTGCDVGGCGAPHFRQGYCMKHDYRMRAWGTTADRPPVCIVRGCERRALSKGEYVGLCRKHANRKARTGTTEDRRPDLRARLLAKIEVLPNGCWQWTGSLGEKGYAHINVGRQPRKAHRIAYELFVAQVPEGLTLDHLCHTRDENCRAGNDCPHRRCVNPEHLEPVTSAENVRRGRGKGGSSAVMLPVSNLRR